MRRDKKQPQAPVRQSSQGGDQDSYAFRRSRTITGSTASTVRAASENRAQLQSPRLHEHSLRSHRRKLSFYLLLTLCLSGVLWFLLSSYIGGSVEVRSSSTQAKTAALDEQSYRTLARAYLAERPLEHFSFSFNHDSFAQYMTQNAPEISDVRVGSTESMGGASMTVTLREPVVGWTIKGEQYFVDAEGVAFTKNYFAAPTVVVADKSGISADAGVIASSRQLRFIGRVITLVNASGLGAVQRVELPAHSTRQVDFWLEGRGYPLKTHLDRDPAGQAADMISALRYADSKGIVPQYLDVRVSSKAFYR